MHATRQFQKTPAATGCAIISSSTVPGAEFYVILRNSTLPSPFELKQNAYTILCYEELLARL